MKHKLVPAAEQKPTLVVWVLYDATTDVKYIKMRPSDGSLAIFDTEEAAMRAKRLYPGTDYGRREYYSAPQPVTVQGEPVGRIKTVGGYPDESEHTIEWLCKYKELKDGDLLYTAPQPTEQQPSSECPGAGCMDQGCPAHYATPDVAKLVEALEGILAVVSESSGVAGYHLNGAIAKWDEFEDVAMAEEALALYHQKRGDV